MPKLWKGARGSTPRMIFNSLGSWILIWSRCGSFQVATNQAPTHWIKSQTQGYTLSNCSCTGAASRRYSQRGLILTARMFLTFSTMTKRLTVMWRCIAGTTRKNWATFRILIYTILHHQNEGEGTVWEAGPCLQTLQSIAHFCNHPDPTSFRLHRSP